MLLSAVLSLSPNYVNPGCGRSKCSPDLEASIARERYSPPKGGQKFWLQWQLADTAWLACARIAASWSAAERPSNAPKQSHSLQQSHPHLNSILESKLHARAPLHWVICIRLIRWHGAHLQAVVIVMEILLPDPEKLPSSLWSRNLRVLPKLIAGHVIAYADDCNFYQNILSFWQECPIILKKTKTQQNKKWNQIVICIMGSN